MNRAEARIVHSAMILVGGTGLVYAWMRYFMTPADEFAVVNHPWQPDVQHLHILFAPLFVFAVGLVWRRHIQSHWQAGVKTGRRSGIGMVLTLTPMVVSGYLIQVAVDPTWRTVWIVVHCVTSGLWVLGYAIHQVASLRRRRASVAQEDAPVKSRQPAPAAFG